MVNINKIDKKLIILFIITVRLMLNTCFAQKANEEKLNLGVYYFNGWTGKTNHITPALKNQFQERKPIWGWISDSPEIMQKEINYAVKAGISFFSFCWYFTNSDPLKYKTHPLNSALGLYLKAPKKNGLKFNILVANHEGAEIRKKDWNFVADEWISLFLNNNYVHVNKMPLITIFSPKQLLMTFGSTDKVKDALDQVRMKAKQRGLNGVSFAACLNNAEDLQIASACGFDIFTGYNYHYAGFNGNLKNPIDSLLNASLKTWNKFTNKGKPYIPAITLNWDPRPWGSINYKNLVSPIYFGYSEVSVFNTVKMTREWINRNKEYTTKERIALVYAWNEYGEGAWLTPNQNNNKLEYLKRALK
jgi:hypothetical protein